MTIGNKIKMIRIFRGYTQKKLGLAVGFDEKSADNRIRQYEMDYRTPKKDTLDKLAKALYVQPANFYTDSPGCAEDILRTLFWLDEQRPYIIRLFQLTCNNLGDWDESADPAIRYNDTLEWPADPPVGLYFNYNTLNYFLRGWLLRQQELKAEKITRDEYFEWKLNWPYTCDEYKGTPQSYIPWRKEDMAKK